MKKRRVEERKNNQSRERKQYEGVSLLYRAVCVERGPREAGPGE